MTRIAITAFDGMMPRIHPELLPPTAAQQCANARIASGALEPWKSPSSVLTLTSASQVQTIYRYGDTVSNPDTQYWFQFTTDVDVVKGPINGDTEEKTYWTDGTYPKKTKASLAIGAPPYPSSNLKMGIPSPSYVTSPYTSPSGYAPVATVSGVATDPNSTPIDSIYVVTYVSSWGEESSPSLPSNQVTWRVGQTVTVTLPGVLSGPYDVTNVRIYRSATGNSRTAFQFLTTKTVASATHADTALNSALGEVIPSFDWDMPPDDLEGLTSMGNGIMAAFFESTLCFSEPYVPYAWPAKYQLSTDAPIVGLGAFGQSLFVGTTRGIYIVSGVDPAGMTMEKLPLSQTCLSKRSIVPMLGGVVFASPDGLFLISPAGSQNLTESILTREEWQAYEPSTIRAWEIDGRYYAFYDNGTKAGLIFTFGQQASFVTTTHYAYAGYQEKLTDSLYFVQAKTGSNNPLVKWNGSSTAMTASWKSKEYRFPFGVNLGAARVWSTVYPCTFKLYGGGVLRHTQTVASSAPFRLPAGTMDTTVSVEVSGTGVVNQVVVATGMAELGSG